MSKANMFSLKSFDPKNDGRSREIWVALYFHRFLYEERAEGFPGTYRSKTNIIKKLREARENEIMEELVANRPVLKLNDIPKLCDDEELNIIFWDKARHGRLPSVIHEFKNEYARSTINICAPEFDIENSYYEMEDLHLIHDIVSFKRKYTSSGNGTFWEVLALSRAQEKSNNLQELWGSSNIQLDEEERFQECFGIGFQIWSRIPRRGKKAIVELVYESGFDESIHLEMVASEWPHDKVMITNTDLFVLRPKHMSKIYRCDKPYNCTYRTFNIAHFKRHQRACSKETKILYNQVNLKKPETGRILLIDDGHITDDVHQEHYVTFDLESLNRVPTENEKLIGGKTDLIFESKVEVKLSISLRLKPKMLTRALKKHPAVAALMNELEQVRLERDEARVRLESNLNETNFGILWELDHITQERDQYLWERDEVTFNSQKLQEELKDLKETETVLEEETERLFYKLKHEESTANIYKARQFDYCKKMVISIPIKYGPDGKNYDEAVRLMEKDIINLFKNREILDLEREFLREEINSLEKQEKPDGENLYLRCAVCLKDVNVRVTGFSMSNCRHAVCTMCSLRCNVCPVCREKSNYKKIIFN